MKFNSGYLAIKHLLSLGLLFVLAVPTTGISKVYSESEKEKLVQQLVAAFNDRNVSRMLELVDEDVQWLTISRDKVTVETSGKKALRNWMVSYFRTCESCKSSLDWIQSRGNRVLAMERATWLSKTGLKSHATLSIYEFRNHKIVRVYYFPSEDNDHAPQR